MAHKVVEGYYLNGAVVYIDDTVVYGKDATSFLQMMALVLDRMAKFNVRLKPAVEVLIWHDFCGVPRSYF